MSQWKKKILNRNNGKGTVTEAKDDDEVKATEVLEFIRATSQKDAKEGKTIRFMHNTGDGSVYWLQGTLEKRMTKYKTAESFGIASELAASASSATGETRNFCLKR